MKNQENYLENKKGWQKEDHIDYFDFKVNCVTLISFPSPKLNSYATLTLANLKNGDNPRYSYVEVMQL